MFIDQTTASKALVEGQKNPTFKKLNDRFTHLCSDLFGTNVLIYKVERNVSSEQGFNVICTSSERKNSGIWTFDGKNTFKYIKDGNNDAL